ncbi:hypothetical protein MASR2M29_23320 [Spirochaetota bacterium]
MKETVCRCENVVKIDVHDPIDLDKNIDMLENIANGNMPGSKCEACGSYVWAPLPLGFTAKSKGLNFVVLPEEERISVYMGKNNKPNEVLLGYQELFERARIIRDGLDPLILELMKYALEAKAAENSDSDEIRAIYNGMSNKGLVFHITGIKADESAVIILPKTSYESSLANMHKNQDKEPYRSLKKGNYHSIKKLDFSENGE